MWLLAQTAPTDPVSYSPLAIVATVVGFLLWRLRDSDSEKDKRIAQLEEQLKAAREEIAEQRSLKHASVGRESAAHGTLVLVGRLYRSKCTCGALEPLIDLLPKE